MRRCRFFLPTCCTAAEAEALLGDRRRALGILGEGGVVHAGCFALCFSAHAENGGDKLRVPRGEDYAHLVGRQAPMVADDGYYAAPHGPLAPVFSQGRPALRQESIAAGGGGLRLC